MFGDDNLARDLSKAKNIWALYPARQWLCAVGDFLFSPEHVEIADLFLITALGRRAGEMLADRTVNGAQEELTEGRRRPSPSPEVRRLWEVVRPLFLDGLLLEQRFFGRVRSVDDAWVHIEVKLSDEDVAFRRVSGSDFRVDISDLKAGTGIEVVSILKRATPESLCEADMGVLEEQEASWRSTWITGPDQAEDEER